MGFQPIELQTMLSQLDKIGHEQLQQTQAAQTQAAIQRDLTAQKNLEKAKTVEAMQKQNGSMAIQKDERGSSGQFAGNGKKRKEEKSSPQKQAAKDPRLGNFLNIYG